MTKIAYSYIRFSTVDQMKGDSLRRQIQLSENYAKKHNLKIDKSLKMQDLGISAFKGDNITSGALGAFLKEIEANNIQQGSYLLVESIDRISRDKVSIALELFLSILRKGIVIVTLNDEMKYEHDNLDIHELMISIITMSRAHNESKIKSERIQKAWENKIDNALEKPVTKWVPAWLKIQDGKIVEIPERVALIQDIFDWVCDGLGTTLILKKINQMNIEPWGASTSVNLNLDKPKNTRNPKRWYASYIQRILTNRAVLGEYHPRKKSKKTNIIKNYYPKIIDEHTFNMVQEIRKSRDVRNGQHTGRKGENITNIFAGILRCGYSQKNNLANNQCSEKESSVTIYSKGRKNPSKYLQCSKSREGGVNCSKCTKLWRYDHFEHAFLQYAKEIDVTTLLGEENERLIQIEKQQKELSSLKVDANKTNTEIDKILDTFKQEDEIPNFITERALEIEKKKISLQKEIEQKQEFIQRLQKQRSNKDKEYQKFQDIISGLQNNDAEKSKELRLKLSETIRRLINRIDLYVMGRTMRKETLEILLKEYPDKKKYIMKNYAHKTEQADPFFVVYYKSGYTRIVILDRKAPKQLIDTIKLDQNNRLVDGLFGKVESD